MNGIAVDSQIDYQFIVLTLNGYMQITKQKDIQSIAVDTSSVY